MIAGAYAGLRVGEAPARSSLVPRDLTAELCLMPLASLEHVRLAACLSQLVLVYATRFARNFAVGNTPCGVLY